MRSLITMLLPKLWLAVLFVSDCHGNRLENEITKRKLDEERLLELVSSLQDQLTAIQAEVAYIRKKTKHSYEILKNGQMTSSNCTILTHDEGRHSNTVIVNSGRKGCPSEFPLKRRDSCYRMEGKKVTWQKASENCKKMDAHLVAIETADESNFLMNIINSDKDIQHCDFWTGATDIKHEGSWIWDHSGKYLTFTNWHTQEPNNGRGDEHCMWLDWYFNWKWNDATCNHQRACYICELSQDDL